MPSWEYYSKRRNIDLVKFILANNIENYEQLQAVCADREIDPSPEKATFQAAYAVAFPPIPKKQPARKPTTKKAAAKPRTTRKSTTRKTSTRKSK